MKTKEFYEEKMLGFLTSLRLELEQSAQSHKITHRVRSKEERARDHLQALIQAPEAEWEAYRPAVEDACQELLEVIEATNLTGN